MRSIFAVLHLAGNARRLQPSPRRPCAGRGTRDEAGHPNSVPNPIFTVSGVPKGTKKIVFAMTDLDVPQFDHGGGSAAYNGDNTIQPGAFEYDSPCPPDGTHTYEWEATAKDSNNDTVGKASAEKSYP